MHVIVANNVYPPIAAGGAELIVSYLCEGLVARGHRVTVVSTCGPDMEPYPTEIRNGVEVIRFFPPNLYWSFERDRQPGLKKRLWHLRDAWNREAGRRFRAIIETARPELLHTHLIDGFSAAIWAMARRAGMPVVHTAHDYHLLCPRAFLMTATWRPCLQPRWICRAYRRWHRATMRHVDLFVSPSRFLLEQHEREGLPVIKRAVVHNGVPQPEAVDWVRRNHGSDSRSRFLMLARLTVEKGVRVVLDAVARLPPQLDITIEIAGKGPLEHEVRNAAARDPRIRYLGYVDGDAKRAAFARCAHLLLPSLWYENAPVTIVEAAAYGLGVIASDIGAIPEFVEHGETGLLFPVGDAASLAAAMQRLAGAHDPLPSLAERSRVLAQRFTVDRMIDRYEACYAALSAAPRLPLHARQTCLPDDALP
jgi:glycosyltransferase involved in cell wall biosynthesis